MNPTELSTRDLDRLVAERVMRFKWMRWHDMSHAGCEPPFTRTLCPPGEWLDDGNKKYVVCNLTNPAELKLKENVSGVPHYSTDPAAMMQVIERMQAQHFLIGIESFTFHDTRSDWWLVQFYRQEGDGHAKDASLPRAICLAALAALPKEEPR